MKLLVAISTIALTINFTNSYAQESDFGTEEGPKSERWLMSRQISVGSNGGTNEKFVFATSTRIFTEKMGFCYISFLQGAYNGNAERGDFTVDSKGRWKLRVFSGGSPVNVGGRCVWLK